MSEKSEMEYEVLLIDATETPIERPKKVEKILLWKEKKTYNKDANNNRKGEQKVICTSFSNGKSHDFRLFKESKVRILEDIKVLADNGYRGMQKIHKNVELLHRKTKKNPLNKEKRNENQELASQRVVVENLIGLLKNYCRQI